MTHKIFAILNLTPDSFSDGEPLASTEFFVEKALSLIHDGADVLDIGAESTRPGSKAISIDEESKRVCDFLKLFRAKKPDFPVSLDSKKYEVALQAMPFKIDYINDVSFLSDTRLAILAKHSNAKYILMHTRGNHDDMLQSCDYGNDLWATLKSEIQQKLELLKSLEIPNQDVILDPGFGFAKTLEQCVLLLENLSQNTFWQDFELPLMLGISRKRFLQHYAGVCEPLARDPISAEWAAKAKCFGFSYFRVHNVGLTKKLLTPGFKKL